MAKAKILTNPDVHSKSENLLHNQSKKPIKVSITREVFYLIQRAEIQLAGLYDLTSEIEAYHSVACLVQPIYDDVVFIVTHLRSEVEKAAGGGNHG